MTLTYRSLSTINREYAALMALPYYDLFDTVLRPRLFKDVAIDHKEVSRIMATYRVNEPQAIAISSSLKAKGFALIQG
jgi:senataxin